MKIRHGDTVVIISGKDKGKTGTVERVLKSDHRVIVSGINMRTRHMKKTAQQAGRIIKYEAAIGMSKVMIVDPKTKKPSRVGYLIKDGKKVRVSKASGTEILKAATAKTAKKTTKKDAKAADGTEAKKEKKTEAPAPTPGDKKTPFWKRMSFGAAIEQAEVPETPQMEKDQAIPNQQQIHRKGGRGS
jgi:large subunit ribosomal protein L24